MPERGLWQSISSVKSLFLTNNFIDLKTKVLDEIPTDGRTSVFPSFLCI